MSVKSWVMFRVLNCERLTLSRITAWGAQWMGPPYVVQRSIEVIYSNTVCVIIVQSLNGARWCQQSKFYYYVFSFSGLSCRHSWHWASYINNHPLCVLFICSERFPMKQVVANSSLSWVVRDYQYLRDNIVWWATLNKPTSPHSTKQHTV